MKSDEELKKTFTVEMNEDGIMYSAFLQVLPDSAEDIRRAELYRDAVYAAIEPVKDDELIDGIVDMSPLGKSIVTPPGKAGKIYSEVAKHPRAGRIAIIGIETMYRAMVKFILMAAHKGDSIKMFTNKKDAIAWLKQK